MNPFIDIPLIGPLFGIFIVFLIPPLLVGGYALLLFTGISWIPRRYLRLLVAAAIAVILSLANYSYENFLRTSLTTSQFISLGSFSFYVTAFFGLTIMALGAVFAWHLMAVHIRTEHPGGLFFTCFVISFLSAFLRGFAALFGPAPARNIPQVLGPHAIDTLVQMFRFYEMVLFGLVVLGLILFLRELMHTTTGMRHNYLIYIAVPFIAIFLFTPFLAGCCALSLTLLFREIRLAMVQRILVIVVPVTLVLAVFGLTKVSDMLSPDNAGLVSFAILAFAVITPLFLFGQVFDRIAVNSLWIVTGSIFTVGITGLFMNLLPRAGLFLGDFTLFVMYIIAVVFACVGHGSIQRALGEYERRVHGTGE